MNKLSVNVKDGVILKRRKCNFIRLMKHWAIWPINSNVLKHWRYQPVKPVQLESSGRFGLNFQLSQNPSPNNYKGMHHAIVLNINTQFYWCKLNRTWMCVGSISTQIYNRMAQAWLEFIKLRFWEVWAQLRVKVRSSKFNLYT